MILLAVFGVEQTGNMVDPWRDVYVRAQWLQSRISLKQAAQVAMHRRAHQLDVVIARNDIDLFSGAKPTAEGSEDCRMIRGDAVEFGYRRVLIPFGRYTGRGRQPHSGEVEEVAEEQETMASAGTVRGLSHEVQPASECVVVGKWIPGVASDRVGATARGQVEVANNDDCRRLAWRHHDSTPVTARNGMTFVLKDHYCSMHS